MVFMVSTWKIPQLVKYLGSLVSKTIPCRKSLRMWRLAVNWEFRSELLIFGLEEELCLHLP